jgi:hypothetical protein
MLEAEYGSSHPIGMVNVKAYDASGKEIEIPKCDKCGCHKSQLIGRDAFIWICTMC